MHTFGKSMVAAVACVGTVGVGGLSFSQAHASVLDDFNNGDIVLDFQFDDLVNTTIPSTSNTGSAGGSFDNDTDNAGVVTNGSGQLDASGKNNTSFGTNYVDIDTITGGRVIGLFEVSWSFDESVYVPDQDEEFRLSLIRDDPRSNFVTAETYFRRDSATEVTLFGNAVGTGAADTPGVTFGSSGSLLTLIDLDLDADVFELLYSADGGTSFTSVGSGTLDPTRGVSSVRLVINENFSGDTLLIERVAVSIPEPSTVGLLAAGLIACAVRRRRRSA